MTQSFHPKAMSRLSSVTRCINILKNRDIKSIGTEQYPECTQFGNSAKRLDLNVLENSNILTAMALIN